MIFNNIKRSMLFIIFSIFGKKTIFPFASHDCVAFSWVDKLLDKLAVENELGKFHFLRLLLSPPPFDHQKKEHITRNVWSILIHDNLMFYFVSPLGIGKKANFQFSWKDISRKFATSMKMKMRWRYEEKCEKILRR